MANKQDFDTRLRMIGTILVLSHTPECCSDLLTVCRCRRYTKPRPPSWWSKGGILCDRGLIWHSLSVVWKKILKATPLCHVFTIDTELYFIIESFSTDLQTMSEELLQVPNDSGHPCVSFHVGEDDPKLDGPAHGEGETAFGFGFSCTISIINPNPYSLAESEWKAQDSEVAKRKHKNRPNHLSIRLWSEVSLEKGWMEPKPTAGEIQLKVALFKRKKKKK